MSELPSSPEECLKKLNRIKTVKSKSYTFARVASQFFHEVEEAKEADRCLSRCQKAIKDLKSEKERYEKMLQEINADISSVNMKDKQVSPPFIVTRISTYTNLPIINLNPFTFEASL
eukprot:m.11149 g.11149  ORF g.11149 m.11149 type:complete len:117 (+) comp23027_c0_seq1:360-710(+)